MPVVGVLMGFCSWLFVEGFEEKRGVGEERIRLIVKDKAKKNGCMPPGKNIWL